jgi:hypothetical protein
MLYQLSYSGISIYKPRVIPIRARFRKTLLYAVTGAVQSAGLVVVGHIIQRGHAWFTRRPDGSEIILLIRRRQGHHPPGL